MTRPYVLKTITATKPVMVNLGRVYLDAGGYDNYGAYWGRGAPLYRFMLELGDEAICEHLRAGSRLQAKIILRERYSPHDIRFYR